MAKVIHYRSRCIGCNICYEQMPEHWRLSRRDGKATLLHSELKKGLYVKAIADADAERWLSVAEACPVRIIKLNL